MAVLCTEINYIMDKSLDRRILNHYRKESRKSDRRFKLFQKRMLKMAESPSLISTPIKFIKWERSKSP